MRQGFSRFRAKLEPHLRTLFSLDHRSVRLFRIAVGFIVVLDVVQRLPVVREFYTDQGVWPRWMVVFDPHTYLTVSLFMVSGSWWWATGLFVLMAILAIALICGVSERRTSFLLLLLLTSAQHRSQHLNYGYDVVMRVMAFWSILLPVHKKQREDNRFCDWVSVCLLLQVAMVYVCAGWLKSADKWLWHPDATHYALSLDFYVSWAGEILLQHTQLLRGLTVMVFLLERFGWMLFFSPWRTGYLRSLAVLALIGMHAAFALFMDLGNFPLADIALLLVVLPTEFWEFLVHRVQGLQMNLARTPPPVISARSAQGFAVGFFLLFAWWNVQDFSTRVLPMPNSVIWMMRAFGLGQSFGMFAPEPMHEAGWVLAEGLRTNGEKVDALRLRERPVSFVRPGSVAQSLPNRHWLDFLVDVAIYEDFPFRLRLAGYLCGEWLRKRHERLQRVDLYYVRQFTSPPGHKPAYFPQVIASQECHVL